MALKIPTVQVGLEKSIQKAVRNVSARGGLNLNVNDKNFSRPLGKINGSISEFNKSLEASNARVLAFGASVGIIQGVQTAFSALLKTTVEVEQRLTEINIVMGLTNSQLESFSKGLFNVAKNTAQSFSTVATAATELARQGLSMEETLKRTNDALILTRLTGLDAESAVSGLTAALNTFNKAGLDSTQILSKMAAVDVQFAVSTEDLIDGVSRAGAVAQDAGVSFDQLLGAVTAAQQQTARGGKVIGNSFKTIFTRVQRSTTINRLEELGIAVRDVAGNTLPAIQVLENLSRTYETLADTTKAAVAEQVGGVFQINILKAAIKDLAEENSILARATQISANATDEAYKKNEILNRSMAALASQTATSIKELANIIGDLGFSDQIRDYLTFLRDQVSGIADFLGQKDGEDAGADFAKGIIKGIGNVISGPGLFLAAAVLGKLFVKTAGFLAGSAKELLGVVSAAERQKRVQESIVAVLAENSGLQKRILSQEGNRVAQEKTILTILQAQAREQQKIVAAARAIGPGILKAGFNTNLTKGKSDGHIPNYVSSEERVSEKIGARSGGYTAGSVRSMNLTGAGRVVYNTAEKVKKFPGMDQPAIMPPKSSSAGKKYQQAFKGVHGFNPYANKGIIPNYARRYKPTPHNIAHGLIYGKKRALNLEGSDGRLLKESWHSSRPAMATGTEMDSIRTLIYKRFLSKADPTFIKQVEGAIGGFGRGVPEAWGGRGKGLIGGMVDDLNLKRAQARGLSASSRMSADRMLGPKDPFMGGAMSQGHVPNYASARIPAKYKTNVRDDGRRNDADGPPKQVFFESSVGGKNFATSHAIDIPDFKDPSKRALQVIMTSEGNPSLRGKGYGKDLYEHMAEYSRKNGYTGLYGDIGTSISAMRVVDSIAKGKKFKVEKAGDLQLRKDIGEKNGMWGGENYTYKISNQGHVPNYGLGNLFRRQSPKTSDRDFLGKGLGAAGKLISTPFKDVGSLLKGGYGAYMKGTDFLGKGILGAAKGGYNAYTNIFETGKHALGKGFDFMKNFPRTTLYGGGGGAGFAFKDEIMAAVQKYGPKALEMGGKLGKGALDIFQNPTSHVDLISAVLGGIVPASVLGLTFLDDVVKLRNQEKSNKIGQELKSKGKHRGNTLVKDLPEDLQRIAIGRMKANPRYGNQTSFVPKSILKELGLASGFVPNYALDNTPINGYRTMLEGTKVFSGDLNNLAQTGEIAEQKRMGNYHSDVGLTSSRSRPAYNEYHNKLDGTVDALKFLDNKGLNKLKEYALKNGLFDGMFELKKSGVGKVDPTNAIDVIKRTSGRDIFNYLAGNTGRISTNIPNHFIKLLEPRSTYKLRDKRQGTKGQLITRRPELDDLLNDMSKKVYSEINLMKKSEPRQRDAVFERASRDNLALAFDPTRGAAYRAHQELIKNRNIGGTLAGLYKSPTGGMSKTILPDQYKNEKGEITKTKKFGDFAIFRDRAKQKAIENKFSIPQRSITVGAAQAASLLRENESAKLLRNRSAISEFEQLVNAKEDPLSIKDAENKIAGRLSVSKDIDDYYSKLDKDFEKSITKPGSYRRRFRAGGSVPNFAMRIAASQIRPFSSKARITKSNYDDIIGTSQLDEILRGRLFTSIKYRPKGADADQDLFLSGARSGVHKYKKGKAPPKGYSSWNDFDLQTGTRVVHAGSAGSGANAYRRLKLNRISSVVSAGKLLRVDPDMASKGLIPNFNLRSKIEAFNARKKGAGLAIRKPSVQASVVGVHPGKNPLTDSYIKAYKQGKISESDLMEMLRGQAKIMGSAGMKKFEAQADYVAMSIKSAPGQIRRNKISDMRSGAVDVSGGLVPNYAGLFSGGASKILSRNPQYSGAVKDAISREASFGLTPKVVSAPSLKSSRNPGLAVVNQEQEGGLLSNARKLHGGLNPNKKDSAVPNYAIQPQGVGDVLQLRKRSQQTVDSQGLNAMETSLKRAASTIDKFSTAAGNARKLLSRLSRDYAASANLIKEANLRTKASLGTLGGESKERQQFIRQKFRQDALSGLAQQGGAIGDLAKNIQASGGSFEKQLLFQMGVAAKSGDVETQKGLEKLNKSLNKSADNAIDQPKSMAKELEKRLKDSSDFNRREKRFMGTEGYGKREMTKHLASDFLASRGISGADGMPLSQEQAQKTLDKMGRRGKEDFTQYASKERGVMSSNAALARAGFESGQFKSMIKNGIPINAEKFKKTLAAYQSSLDSGQLKDQKNLRRELLTQSARIGGDPIQASRMQSMIAAMTSESKNKEKEKKNKERQTRATRQVGQGGFINSIKGAFNAGRSGLNISSGGNVLSRGAQAASRGAGSMVGGFKPAMQKFASQGMGGFGGQIGLGLSFIAPMLGGMLSSKQSRESRASLVDGQYQVGERGGDVASSTLTGLGMGAIFGLPGAIIGASAGFISSMKDATLTIDEQTRIREKEINLISQNLQATQNIQNLSNERAVAFNDGDFNKVNKIDAATNRALSGINDKDILKRLASAGGNPEAISDIQKQLQDDISNAVSIQNFGVALKSSDQTKAAKNAGVAMGSIIAQSIRNEDIDEFKAIEALQDIQTSAQIRQKGLSEKLGIDGTKELNAIRKRAEGQQGLGSAGTVSGGLIGGAAGFGLGTLAAGAGAAALGLATGGLAIPLMLAAAGASVGAGVGRYTESGFAQSDLDDATRLGVDEIGELSKLVEAGAMTEVQMQQLTAAFREGEISIGDIAEEAKDAVVEFQKIKKSADRASASLFEIEKTFKRTIGKLVVDLEVSKIRQGATARADSSNAQFSSQFLSPINASSFLGREQGRILNVNAQSNIENFQSESDINFLRQVKSQNKNLNLTAPQMDYIRETVQNEGSAPIESMIRRREMGGTMKMNLGTAELNDIFKSIGFKGVDDFQNSGSDFSNAKMPTELDSRSNLMQLFGTETGGEGIKEEARIIQEIITDLDSIRNTGKFVTDFSKKLDPKGASSLTEILDSQKERFRIIQAKILAERKALSVQIAQNNIQAKIQTELEVLQQNLQNRDIKAQTDLLGNRGAAETKKSFFGFQANSPDLFRGITSDETENTRQEGLRKKTFNEDFRVKKQEALNTFKREAAKLLSEKSLIDALNGLESTISGQLDKASGEGSQALGPSLIVNKPGTGQPGPGSKTLVGMPSAAIQRRLGTKSEDIERSGKEISTLQGGLKKKISREEYLAGGKSGPGRIKQLEDLGIRLNDLDRLSNKRPTNFLGVKTGSSERGREMEKIRKSLESNFPEISIDDVESYQGVKTPLGTSRVIDYRNLQTETRTRKTPKTAEDIVKEIGPQVADMQNEARATKSNINRDKQEIANLTDLIEKRRKEIIEIENSANDSLVGLSDKLAGENLDLSGINFDETKNLINQVLATGDIDSAFNIFNSNVKSLLEDDPSGLIAEKVNSLSAILNNLKAGLTEFERGFDVQEAQKAVQEFNQGLKFSTYSAGGRQQINDNRNIQTRAAAGARAVDAVAGQIGRQKQLEIAMQDPTASSADKARARIELESSTIGTEDQRQRLMKMQNDFSDNNSALTVARMNKQLSQTQLKKNPADVGAAKTLASSNADIKKLEQGMRVLDKSMNDLALIMDKETPRDKGFLSEFGQNMGSGLSLGFGEIQEQSEQIYTQLGRDLPVVFRDGLVDAMQAALDGTQSIGDSFRQIGVDLLKTMQRAFLTSAANRMTGMVGDAFNLEMNQGGFVNGGSGVKDDVPAMLMGGEYVIKKSAVDRYGVNFLENLNRGNLQGYADGGAVGLRVGAPMVAEREKYIDENKDGNVTRYKTTKPGIGINSQLTGYAIANDRSIQKHFRDQENQFQQDLATKKQEEMRQKNKQYRKEVLKNSIWNSIIGIAGGALLSKGLSWAQGKYRGTDFAKNRASKRRASKLQDQGYFKVNGQSIEKTFPKPSDQSLFRQQSRDVFKNQGPKGLGNFLYDNNVKGIVDSESFQLNKGGSVPATLTGGEYVMSPSAVKTYGTSLMDGINSGRMPSSGSSSNQNSSVNNVSHGDVNVNINISSSGSTSSSGADINSNEFATKVKSAVMQVIAKEKRVGGSLR